MDTKRAVEKGSILQGFFAKFYSFFPFRFLKAGLRKHIRKAAAVAPAGCLPENDPIPKRQF